MTIYEKALEVQPFVQDCRHTIHRWPELGMEEFRTTDFICEKLDEMGIPYRRLEPTGCIAEIKGNQSGKIVALRADIDALQMNEINDLPFRSERPGYMHGCGHDTHTAMLLGAAKVLNTMREEINGTVRLIFQPSEENGLGSQVVVDQGGMEGVSACFGEHVFGGTGEKVGVVHYKKGGLFPSADTFWIHVHGIGCHGAMPDMGVDATVCAAAIVMNLQSIASREISPLEPVVVTVGSLHSGTAYNICSGEAEMTGTVRTFSKEHRKTFPDRLRRIVENTARAYRCTAEVEYGCGSSALINDSYVTEIARKAAEKILPDSSLLVEGGGSMGAEDFSLYTEYVPCTFFTIGCGEETFNHNEHFVVDESIFPSGVALHVQFAIDYLNDQATNT